MYVEGAVLPANCWSTAVCSFFVICPSETIPSISCVSQDCKPEDYE